MAKPKLFVADYQGYARPFREIFDITEKLKEADCLMFTGGEDVDPRTYGDPAGRYTYYTAARDRYELEYFNIAQSLDIPILGICRGHQLLCAVSGGKLVQDCTGHTRGHEITTDSGERYPMSSLHHQMVRLEGIDHKLIAWATTPLSRRYLDGKDNEIYGHEIQHEYENGDRSKPPIAVHSTHVEPEIVWFSKVKGLGIQGHPEMMREDSPTVEYCRQLVKEYILGESISEKAAA